MHEHETAYLYGGAAIVALASALLFLFFAGCARPANAKTQSSRIGLVADLDEHLGAGDEWTHYQKRRVANTAACWTPSALPPSQVTFARNRLDDVLLAPPRRPQKIPADEDSALPH